MILSHRPTQNDLIQSLVQLQLQAASHRHRYAVVLSGTQGWASDLALKAITQFADKSTLWVGTPPDAQITHRNPGCAHTVLGQEYDLVVFNAHEGFDADDFGALSGVVRAGGLLIILAPKFSQWVNKIDSSMKKMLIAGYDPEQVGHRFIQRLTRMLNQERDVLILREGEPLKTLPLHTSEIQTGLPLDISTDHCATQDQGLAVESIVKMFLSEDATSIVLISDRGRGKSSALGIAAAELLVRGVGRILLTAPRLTAVNAVFERAIAALPEAEYQSGGLNTPNGTLTFVAPDELIRQPQEADLLMVDEAAAIPGQLLSRLLDHYSKVVFATTVHGYEGSGRGFELRFSRTLDQKRPGWKKLRMSQPVRWAEQDPLEALSFKTLLMDASPVDGSRLQGLKLEDCQCEQLDRDHLLDDESLMNELFGLLITAHYRTRPFDLRYLLDAPNVSIYILRWHGHIVATAMLAKEGGFDDHTSLCIYAGLRRPRGHLLAQSLSAHVGVEAAPGKRYMRVVRIAVHPELQGRGLGTSLLEGVVKAVKGQDIDAIGASFAADADVLSFWHRCGFHAVHVGISQEHTSGSHPVMMLRPLSQAGELLFTEARQRYARRLHSLLDDVLAGIDEQVRIQLLADLCPRQQTLDTQHELLAYAYARRGFEVSLYAIELLLITLFEQSLPDYLDSRQRSLLEMRVVQHRDWRSVVQSLGLSGKREAQELMRQTLAQIIDRTGDAEILRYRDGLMQLDGRVDAASE